MVLVIATAGLVYELCMAAVASYLLGDSVRQFSLIIGVYLSALGLGAYLSQYIATRVAETFVYVELSAALLGGLSAPLLFATFALTDAFALVLYGFVVLVGTLVGLELPLLIRLLERNYSLKQLVAQALTFDYAGALLGSLGFSLFLVPHLGLAQSSVVCGLLNALVGLASTWVLPALPSVSSSAHGSSSEPRQGTGLRAARRKAWVVVVGLLAFLPFAERCLEWSEQHQYPGRVTHSETSQYQRIVIVEQSNDHFSLFLNGHLQFDSTDEQLYHVALTAPALAVTPTPHRVLVGGGGDGLAVRELLTWPGVERVVVVDLDPAITDLAKHHSALSRLNRQSLHDPRVQVINADAMTWLSETDHVFDVVILDFPDPSNYALGKLYSEQFYSRVLPRLAEDGTLAVQASSPLLARTTFWCTVHTLQAVGFHAVPYHRLVPSFGEWGFVLARRRAFEPPLPPSSAFVETDAWHAWFTFPEDMAEVPTDTNRINTQKLVAYYLNEWGRLQ